MKLYVVDAFAKEPFRGNPAAVCVMAAWPDDEAMQALAKKNGLSERIFGEAGSFCIRAAKRKKPLQYRQKSDNILLSGHCRQGLARPSVLRIVFCRRDAA